MQRQTRQRQVIQDVFHDAGRPLSVPEAHEQAKQAIERLGVATVYRAVNALVEEGWLHAVELPGEPPRYELADLDHHHHFHCTVCDRVFDIEGCALNHKPELPAGFTLEGHEIILYGRCDRCAPTPAPGRGKGKTASKPRRRK